MKFFDTHCHFDADSFDRDRDLVWQHCRDSGISDLLVPGVIPSQWESARRLSERDGIWYAVGLHPLWIEEWQGQTGEVKTAVKQLEQALLAALDVNDTAKLVAIGECGLDKTSVLAIADQEAFFALQVALAAEHRLPVVVHARGTHAQILRVLRDVKSPAGGVIHAFSGSYEIAKSYWDLGFRLGVGGVITYERAHKTRQAIARMPLESLVLESDAPDMPHAGRQGERNSPEYIPRIAGVIAELKNLSVSDVARASFANSLALYQRHY